MMRLGLILPCSSMMTARSTIQETGCRRADSNIRSIWRFGFRSWIWRRSSWSVRNYSLWDGALKQAHAQEAPHLYKISGYYYLLIAEGGTGFTHAVTIAAERIAYRTLRGMQTQSDLDASASWQTARYCQRRPCGSCSNADRGVVDGMFGFPAVWWALPEYGARNIPRFRGLGGRLAVSESGQRNH